MARHHRKRKRRGAYRRRQRRKYAVQLPMRKRSQMSMVDPGVLLYRGGFNIQTQRGECITAPIGSMFPKDAIDTNDFNNYSAGDLLPLIGGVIVPTSKCWIHDVKRVWMFTNSSVSAIKYIIYKGRARRTVPSTKSMTTILAGTSYDYADALTGYSNIQPTTIGSTPYDNPLLTNLFRIKPVKTGVVGAGGTFEFKAKKHIRTTYSRMNVSTYDGVTATHDADKYSDVYFIQFHGQPCAGVDTGAVDKVTFAACELDVASYARVTYAKIFDDAIQTQTRMDTTNPFAAATSATLYAPGNIAANTAPGVPDTIIP